MTRSSKSGSRTTSHSKSNSSERRSTLEPDSFATASSSSWSSFSARTNSPAERDLKQTPAEPVDFSPSSASSVMRAVEIANSRSPAASLSFLRPKRTLPRPKR